MKLNPEVAVVNDREFMTTKLVKTPLSTTITSIGQLVQAALDANLSYVWIMPGSELSRSIDRNFMAAGEEWDVFASYSKLDEKRPMFSRIWKKKTSGRAGRTVYVGFPEYGNWYWKCPDEITLLATVTYLENALQIPPLWSSGRMALDLLKALNVERRTSWLTPLTTDLRTLSVSGEKKLPLMRTARDLTWKRALTAKEKKKKFVHKYDKNSMYLGACTGVAVGEGDPEYVDEQGYDEKAPGFWHVKAERGESPYDSINLPSPARTEWMTTPMVQCCKKLGYQIEVTEGYRWTTYHRTLESWATLLWAVRQSFKPSSPTFNPEYKHEIARENAYNTIGDMAHVGIGKLADEDTSSGLYRADIWAQVVGRSCANIFYNIDNLRKSGYIPALVYTDALWFISDDPNPITAIPGLSDRSDKLGGYKVVYEPPLAMGKAVIEAFTTIESPAKLVTMLNQLAGETYDEHTLREIG